MSIIERKQAAVERRRYSLPAGDIEIATRAGSVPVDALCDFAVRNNARRGFLIVSRVLGRHLPVAPAVMQASFDALARTIPADLPGPVLFIGMAETAICLGQAVHAAWRAAHRRSDTLYIHTTRQQIDAPVIATFEEPHSHASAHLIYAPLDVTHRALVQSARSLVLVDDEASTGTTFCNLANAMMPALPRVSRIHTAVLADWTGKGSYAESMPLPTTVTSLLQGSIRFEPRLGRAAGVAAEAAAPVAALGRMARHRNFGRLGIQSLTDDFSRLVTSAGRQRFLVLGTGEFVFPPFLLAAQLEAQGHEVAVQAISRSPIHIGGAIHSAIRLEDNYGTGVPNYIYNVEPEAGRTVLICHETPPGSIDPEFVARLGARCVYFGDSD